MTTLNPTLESVLTRTRQRHKWLRFLRYVACLGIALAASVLLLGSAMSRGWLTSPGLALVLFGGLAAVASLALPAIALVALLIDRSRAWSAGQVEDANPSLLDRLHTLVFLGSAKEHRDDPALDAYGRRIEKQAIREMTLAVQPLAEERRKTRLLWLACLLLVLATGLFYSRFHPFDRLRMGEMWNGPVFPEKADPFGEAPIADAAELQEEKEAPAWGEIRITEPGRDLKVTKVDVVPLQIEAAASHPLTAASWVTSLTGEEPQERRLPPPEEPRFAVYKPYFYVDELGLSDWDVVTYHARASTSADDYASEVYFLEVRPFQEEIEKMAGGGGGADLMNQCSGLIDRQKHVLRQTHRFLARGRDADADVRRQDQEKLVEAEADLTEAVAHLYAEMASKMENQAIADVLDHLALAEEELEEATAALEVDPATAPPPEQSALAELVATRKNLQRAINENPEAFGGRSSDDEPFPIAEERVKRIAEFRDQEKAAQELLDELIEEQRRIGEACQSAGPGEAGRLAADQEASRRRLEQFAGDHPRLFEEAREEARRADQALASMREALEQRDPDLASERQGEALASLEDLRREVERRTARRQLADTYELKRLLDRQAEKMGEIESSPDEVSGEEAGRAAAAAKETTRELKELMEESPVGEGFGPELHQALSDARQGERERALDAVGEAGGGAERSRAAERARQGLEEVSDAFEKSAPQLVRELREEDALAESGEEAIANAIRRLQAMQAGGRGSPGEAALRREVLFELRRGLEDMDADARRVEALLEEAEEALEHDEEIDPAKLARLLDELERFRTEIGGVEAEKLELDLAHIDPSTLPAEYRERIQNYFRTLSEQR